MAFPTTGILDTFDRANSGSLGASWGNGVFSGFSGHDIVSNAATNGDHSHYIAATYGPDQEAFFTITTIGAGAIVGLHMRGQTPGAGGDAYEIIWRDSGDIEVVRVIDSYTTETSLLSTLYSSAPANGNKFGAEVLGTGATVTINIYVDVGSGWVLAASTTDTGGTRITSAGHIGFVTTNTATVINDFGGGTVAGGGVPRDIYHYRRRRA